MIRDRTLYGLTNPPRRVRRELEATPPVELLDRAVESQGSLLDEVEERNTEAAIALRDRYHQAEVRLDHLPLGDGVAPLDPLRERDLFGRREQLVPPDIGEEELQAVSRAGDGVGLVLSLRCDLLLGVRGLAGSPDLDRVGLELALQELGLLLSEIVLDDERLEVGRLQVSAVLLAALDERLHMLGLKQFDELVLRQSGVSILSARRSNKRTECMTRFGLFPG